MARKPVLHFAWFRYLNKKWVPVRVDILSLDVLSRFCREVELYMEFIELQVASSQICSLWPSSFL